MADPRFYRNRGPFDLAAIGAKAGIPLPLLADGAARIWDVAGLRGAGPLHLSFFPGDGEQAEALARARATYVLAPAQTHEIAAPKGMILLRVASVPAAFASIAALFYPDPPVMPVQPGIDPTAQIGRDVLLGPDVAIGPGAQIGDRCRIGAASVIGPGVTVGHDCDIGDAAVISHAHFGDRATARSGAQIGHGGDALRLGRVIIQDRAEIGAACVIERGYLGDTVIGEGARVDDQVQVGSDTQVGRHGVLRARGSAGP